MSLTDVSGLFVVWFCRHLRHLVVDGPELPGPFGVVEERSEVKAVVVRAVALSVVGRCHCGHLVPVY